MNLAELRQKIIDDGGRSDKIVVSTREEDFDERGYNVVPQLDGTYIVIINDGRGSWRAIETFDSDCPRVFRTESEPCEWIWNDIQTSKIPPELTIARTPEEEAEWRRQAEENYKRILERFEAAKRPTGA